jgi:hypothetical protein
VRWKTGLLLPVSGPARYKVLKDSLAQAPAVHRWLETVGNRPAVARGVDVPPSPSSRI